jgi:hypothetical protein
MLASGTGNAVVTTNWDIVIERHLGDSPFHYSILMTDVHGEAVPRHGTPIMKLHGSSNWAYCDCCGRLFAFGLREGKGALHRQDRFLLIHRTLHFSVNRQTPPLSCALVARHAHSVRFPSRHELQHSAS